MVQDGAGRLHPRLLPEAKLHVRTLLLAFAATLILTAPAPAVVTPIDLGPGNRPSVVVDPAGTAHILWVIENFSAPQYCRLPRGATACDLRSAITNAQT